MSHRTTNHHPQTRDQNRPPLTRSTPLVSRVLVLIGAMLGASAAGSAAHAQLISHGGFDLISSPTISSATNSVTAEANWLADAGLLSNPIHTVDFESMTPGISAFTHTIAPGVTMSVPSHYYYPDNLQVMSGSTIYAPLSGYNTTAGGANHMRFEMSGGSIHAPTVMLNFATPINAISLFITGEGESNWTFSYPNTRLSAGPPSSMVGLGDHGNPYWPSTQQPNARFIGLIDPTASFTSVAIAFRHRSSDLYWHGSFSLDDIRWVEAPVPAPGTLALLGLPLAAIRRRR